MAVKNLSIADLERELSRRQKALSNLEAKHKGLLSDLAAVEKEIAGLRGSGARATGRKVARKSTAKKRGPGRPRKVAAKAGKAKKGAPRGRRKNKLTLPDAIAKVVKVGKVTSPKDAARVVKASGYKTVSKTFGIQVATTLSKDARFKKVGRGQYKRVK